MNTLKFVLKSLLKQRRHSKRTSGFTLLELLVALVLTLLIITPLLSLVTGLMNNERQEQAKVASQQEIQAALDYIAQDLQQAVYIYDAGALSRNNSADPALSGISNQIPPGGGLIKGCGNTNCVPVLAFWKRKFLGRNDTVRDTVANKDVEIGKIKDSSENSDRFVYSLVVYYLIKDQVNTPDNPWSPVARIGRFEIRDGILSPASTALNPQYLLNPDPGFASFNTAAGTGTQAASLQTRMNTWQKKGNYNANQGVEILVDYIDDTAFAAVPPDLQPQFTPPLDAGCVDRTGVGSSRVPPDTIDTIKTGSFYACVNPANAQGQSVAQVFLRGNALPRLRENPTTWTINQGNKQNQLASRPTANVLVAVRGLLSEGQSQ